MIVSILFLTLTIVALVILAGLFHVEFQETHRLIEEQRKLIESLTISIDNIYKDKFQDLYNGM